MNKLKANKLNTVIILLILLMNAKSVKKYIPDIIENIPIYFANLSLSLTSVYPEISHSCFLYQIKYAKIKHIIAAIIPIINIQKYPPPKNKLSPYYNQSHKYISYIRVKFLYFYTHNHQQAFEHLMVHFSPLYQILKPLFDQT